MLTKQLREFERWADDADNFKKNLPFSVYKLVNSKKEIEYIGESSNIQNRLKVHLSTQGKFYNRKDISAVIIKSFKTKKEAFAYQLELQKKYGFVTDTQKLKDNASSGLSARIDSIKKNGTGKREINCFDYKTKKFISNFPSIRNAEKTLNVDNIEKVLNGKYKQVGGYYFEYKK